MDITMRKHLLEQIQVKQEHLQSLSRRLMEVQETDRRFLASELHDQIGQNLTALSINLNIICSQFSKEVDKKIVDRLEDSMKIVEETIERMRNVMAGLRPPVLDDYGLMVALRWYTERFSERTGIATILQERQLSPRLPLVVETELFRIVQEVLTNVAKHADARQAIITLERVNGMVQLVISDDGVGFDPTVLRQLKEQPGWGLITIEERAKALGGDVSVESLPGKGTKVIVKVPR
jgi:two-component system sensor histidine kinase UhpB